MASMMTIKRVPGVAAPRSCLQLEAHSGVCMNAGIVRLLRKLFMQLSQKNREFVALSLKFEKNTAQQVIHC